jgi:hypothetical protein
MQPEVDFFAALKQLQSEAANSHINPNDSEPETETHDCLITHQPLNAFHVRLTCGHAFNYEPLFQEVMRQKGRLGMHNYHEPIATHQIKCPYCRSMTNRLLPYIGTSPHPLIKRFAGVNAPAHMCMPGTPCQAKKCHANAFYECNQALYCHKHYQVALKPKPAKPSPAAATRCLAENQTGKNKGTQCKRPASPGGTLCKMHAKCNIVVM